MSKISSLAGPECQADPIKGDGFMTLRKRAGGALFTVTAAALAIGLGATTALAATTLTVKVTGSSSTGTVTASTSKTVFKDTRSGVTVTCTSSKASSSVPNGTHTGTSPVTIGSIKSLSFSGCTGPTGSVTIKVNKLPYALKIDSKTVSGKTDGIVTGVNNSVSTLGCSFVVTGSAPGFYNNGTHTLTQTPKLPITPLNKAVLTVSGVSGCSGLVINGDHATFTATYTVSPSSLKITSS
jgi:hypothetical protein